MSDLNPYEAPLADEHARDAVSTRAKSRVRDLLLVGAGGGVGAILALPFLISGASGAILGPFAGAVLGGLVARMILPAGGRRQANRPSRLLLLTAFVILGPLVGLIGGVLVLSVMGEPLHAPNFLGFMALGTVGGMAAAVGALILGR